MDLILKAIRFAEEKHKGQKRKVSGKEYLNHPVTVSYIIANYKKSKNLIILICAGILHDTVEDCDVTFDELVIEFGMPIASLVFEVTDDKKEIKKLGKLEYSKKRWLGYSSYGLFLRLCDRLYNMMDSPTDEAVRITKELIMFIEKKRRLTKSQKTVIEEIKRVIKEKECLKKENENENI